MPAASSRARSQTGDSPTRTSRKQPPDVARRTLEVLDRDVDRLVAGPFGIAAGRLREVELEERRHLTRDAVHREQIGAVPRDLEVEDDVLERQDISERRPRLAFLEHDDSRVVVAELELLLGEDHPGGVLAADLAPVEHEPARKRRAGKRHRDGRPGPEVPGAAHDLVRLDLPHVDDAELEPVRVRVLLGLQHAPDAEEPEVAVQVGHAAALDRRDHRRRPVDAVGELLEGHLQGDVVAEPGERNAHR